MLASPLRPRSLRQLIESPGLTVAPGAYDAITARLVEQAGFPLVYMTGAGTAAARGFPDYGLLTMTEMADNAAIIARSVAVPVLADADTGYGNELNVTRTVREFESRGVAGIHRWTAPTPPSTPARTRPSSRRWRQQVAAVSQRVHGPCLLNIVPGGKTPVSDLSQAEELGYRIAICPGLLLGAAITAGDMVLRELVETRRHPDGGQRSPGALFRRFGAGEWDEIRKRFG